MTSVNYQFLEHHDSKGSTRVNYSFLLEKEACKKKENSVKYLFLEYLQEK